MLLCIVTNAVLFSSLMSYENIPQIEESANPRLFMNTCGTACVFQRPVMDAANMQPFSKGAIRLV